MTLHYQDGHLQGRGEMVNFPLRFPLVAYSGPLSGKGFWTGAVRFSMPLADPLAGSMVLAGEQLRFTGGGDTLSGTAALRYLNRTLYVNHLQIGGKGTWSGSGSWGPSGGDLRLELKDTSFTPILSLIPQLKAYKPTAKGTLIFSASGSKAELTTSDMSFTLGAFAGSLGKATLELGRTLVLSGNMQLSKPYPAVMTLQGRGKLERFIINAEGSARFPLLGEVTGISARLAYPGLTVTAHTKDAELSGGLSPLKFSMRGALAVSYPKYYLQRGTMDADLELAERSGTYHLSGSVGVRGATLAFPQGQRRVGFGKTEAQGPGLPLEFDGLNIYTEQPIIVQEALAQGSIGGAVSLTGALSDPYLYGWAKVLRGSFLLLDHRFGIDSATADFSPEGGLYPRINVHASTSITTSSGPIKLLLAATGQFEPVDQRMQLVLSPTLSIASPTQEAYTQAQLYALLTVGTTDINKLPEKLTRGAISAVVDNLLISQLEHDLANALGLDVFQVSTPVFKGGKPSQTSLTLGKYLTPEFYLGYTVDFSGQQAFVAEYQLGEFRLSVQSGLSSTPSPRISLSYVFSPDLDLSLSLSSERTSFGLDWRF